MTYKQLTIEERYQIKTYLKTEMSYKDISIELERHFSTIKREIKRNTGKKDYRPKQAEELAQKRRKTACKANGGDLYRFMRHTLHKTHRKRYGSNQKRGRIKNATELADQIIPVLTPLKDDIYSITYDNGLEFSEHERVSEALEMNTCFAHPYSSWERGINENTNGLIRQYFAKGTDFKVVFKNLCQIKLKLLHVKSNLI